MVDRVVPLLIALTLVAPAALRPACCCVAPAAGDECCVVNADLPSCCSGPSCCAGESTGPAAPCGCEDCPTNKPLDPLAPSSEAPRVPVDDAPAFAERIAAAPLPVVGVARATTAPGGLKYRPPRERRAWLGVWTI